MCSSCKNSFITVSGDTSPSGSNKRATCDATPHLVGRSPTAAKQATMSIVMPSAWRSHRTPRTVSCEPRACGGWLLNKTFTYVASSSHACSNAAAGSCCLTPSAPLMRLCRDAEFVRNFRILNLPALKRFLSFLYERNVSSPLSHADARSSTYKLLMTCSTNAGFSR